MRVWSAKYGEFGFVDCEYVRIVRVSTGQSGSSVNCAAITKLEPCGTFG